MTLSLRLPDVRFAHGRAAYASRPDSLEGLKIGYLDGWGDHLDESSGGMYPTMAAFQQLLSDRHGVAGFSWLRKPSISQDVPDHLLVPFVREVDLVINGEGL